MGAWDVLFFFFTHLFSPFGEKASRGLKRGGEQKSVGERKACGPRGKNERNDTRKDRTSGSHYSCVTVLRTDGQHRVGWGRETQKRGKPRRADTTARRIDEESIRRFSDESTVCRALANSVKSAR